MAGGGGIKNLPSRFMLLNKDEHRPDEPLGARMKT